MIKKLLILTVALGAFACSKKEEKQSSKKDRIEITPFKISKVFLRDTQSVKTIYLLTDSGRMSITDYQFNWDKDYKFLDITSFNALRKSVWALVKDPQARVYVNPLGSASTQKEVQDRVVICGNIQETSFDAEGNEVIQTRFNCDSMSAIRHINQIRFFESWYFDPGTNMIEREILGYSMHEFVSDKNAFRELFTVFVNDEALGKARKYYFKN